MMFTEENIQKFCSEITEKKGMELISVIEKYKTENVILENGSKESLFNEGQQEILNRVIDTAKKYPEADFEYLLKKMAENIKKNSDSLKPEVLLEQIRNKGEEARNEIVPLNGDDYADYFIFRCYLRKKNSRRFFERLIREKQVTKEHMVPKSTCGIDDLSNYIYECSRCNGIRANKPFIG